MAPSSLGRALGVALIGFAPAVIAAQQPDPNGYLTENGRSGVTNIGEAARQYQTTVRLGNRQVTMTAAKRVVASGDVNVDPQYQTPIGTGYDGVASLELTTTQGLFICSGSLLADGRTILTAAHCLTGASADPTFQTTSVTANFFPTGAASPISLTSTQFIVNPLYTGQVIDENDIGLIRLAAPAPTSITRYNLFTDDALGDDFTFAGHGRRGSNGIGATQGAGFGFPFRRKGMNTFDSLLGDSRWEGFWDDPSAASANILFTDFDNGSTGFASNDASCVISQFFSLFGTTQCDAGLGTNEANTAGGDSGGPGFINGRIASLTSFGLTFGQLGGAAFPFPDIDNSLNSSFGEFSGYTNVAYHSEWINDNLVSAVPEPATYALFGSGLVIILGVARRRRA